MLHIDYLSNKSITGDVKLDLDIIKYQNLVISEIIEDRISILDGCDWEQDYLELYLPRQYIEDNRQSAKSVILDLLDIFSSAAVRDHLSPLFEYALFRIINDEIDYLEDTKGNTRIQMPPELKKQIEQTMETNGYNPLDISFAIDWIEDLNNYLESMFYDEDFLDIDNICSMFLHDIPADELLGIKIEDYFDVLARDLKKEYIAKKLDKEAPSSQSIVLSTITGAIIKIQNRALEYQQMSEVEISNRLEEMINTPLYLQSNIITAREAPIGCSTVRLGEADILLYKQEKQYENIAIIENKFINQSFQEFLQLFGYLNHTFQYGITISINKEYTLVKAKQIICDALQRISANGQINITEVIDNNNLSNIIISRHSIPENPEQTMTVYHIILNLNTNERQKVAKAARKAKN